jgi:hypothetical protein
VTVPRREGPSIAFLSIQNRPTTVTIRERRDQQIVTTEVKTTLEARYAPLPIYFNVKPDGLSLHLIVATDLFPSSFADTLEMIDRRYRLPVAPARVGAWRTSGAEPTLECPISGAKPAQKRSRRAGVR